MNTQHLLTTPSDPSAWDQTLYAFLAEKHRRSGSGRTVQGYSSTLRHCFARIGKTPDQITGPDVLGWAHCVGLSGRQPSAVTIGARTACLSSFYRFCIRMGLLAANPCDALDARRSSRLPPEATPPTRSASCSPSSRTTRPGDAIGPSC